MGKSDQIIDREGDPILLKDLILTVRKWTTYLLSKWYILVLVGLIGALAGFYYAKLKKPLYIATTTFVLESGDQSGNLGQYAGMAAMVGINLGGTGGGIFQGDNLLELYKSRKMIESALLKPCNNDSSKLLVDLYLDLNHTRDKWKQESPDLLKIDFNQATDGNLRRSRDSILQSIVVDINKKNLTVDKLDKKLSIIKVDVSSESELFSKEFNEAIVDEVNTFYITTKTKKSLDNIDILQYKTDSVRRVMNSSISATAAAIDATPNLNPTRQAQRMIPTQRSQFSAETNKAILGQLVQNLEMSKMALMKEAPLIQKVDEPIYPLTKQKASKLFFAVVLGLVLSTLAAIILIFDRKLRTL